MGAFEYIALDAQGRERKGLIEGDTPKHVRQMLRDKQLLPMEIQETAQKELKKSRARGFMRRGLSTLDLALLTRQLATLLHSGLPLEESLQAVAEQTEKPRVQRIVLGVRSKVVEGHPLADGLRDFPQAFPEIYRATVSAGEQSGDQHAQQRDHAAKKPGPALLRRETARLLLSRRGLSRGTGLVPVGLRTDLWPG